MSCDIKTHQGIIKLTGPTKKENWSLINNGLTLYQIKVDSYEFRDVPCIPLPYSEYFTLSVSNQQLFKPSFICGSVSDSGINLPLKGPNEFMDLNQKNNLIVPLHDHYNTPTTSTVEINLKDEFGNPAQFSKGNIYLTFYYGNYIPKQTAGSPAALFLNHGPGKVNLSGLYDLR